MEIGSGRRVRRFYFPSRILTTWVLIHFQAYSAFAQLQTLSTRGQHCKLNMSLPIAVRDWISSAPGKAWKQELDGIVAYYNNFASTELDYNEINRLSIGQEIFLAPQCSSCWYMARQDLPHITKTTDNEIWNLDIQALANLTGGSTWFACQCLGGPMKFRSIRTYGGLENSIPVALLVLSGPSVTNDVYCR